jgi:hypothetical protein
MEILVRNCERPQDIKLECKCGHKGFGIIDFPVISKAGILKGVFSCSKCGSTNLKRI